MLPMEVKSPNCYDDSKPKGICCGCVELHYTLFAMKYVQDWPCFNLLLYPDTLFPTIRYYTHKNPQIKPRS